MPADVLARWVQAPGDLPGRLMIPFTDEQLVAIERRQGDLLLDASAGSGKTSVLVERFVRAVLDDEVEVSAILTITFTDKAAAELRDRIRARLRWCGADDAARATEGAFISTIHGFCARVLRAHALSGGLDPAFVVLDEADAVRLADAAFEEALDDLAQNAPGGVELVAAYGFGALRGAIAGVYGELRSRGEIDPGLPPLPPPPDLDGARRELARAAAAVAGELGTIADPSVRVVQALERLGRCTDAVGAKDPWPGELERLCLPRGNGVALSTPACVEYSEALAGFRSACEHRRAEGTHRLLDRLLRFFGERYTNGKRKRSALDFADLELLARELLSVAGEPRERYAERFTHVMVDELQDVNPVQMQLIESVARDNLFTVGDAQQSIYGFRHADVELFERRALRLAALDARPTLQTNFRSRPAILRELNSAFALALGDRFRPLRPGRSDPVPATGEPLVELLIAEKGADWADPDGLASPWRVAEARALAARVAELVAGGAKPGDVVVLARASTDLRTYERALENLGVPTYTIGGRGYWAHPQVVDLLAYLSALANPREEEALYTVLASRLVGVGLDALVVLAAAARAAARDPWWVLRDPGGTFDELAAPDRDRLAAFARWFAGERAAASRVGIEELIERALELTGYDLAMLAMPGGARRLANVRKLMRLARAHEAAGGGGGGLRAFLELVQRRSPGWGGADGSRESEAPVEGEALDAVRLMTIHRAKGLEFEIVCVADLGRGPRHRAELLRIGRDGRLGLRLAEPGTAKREPALHYAELGAEQQRCEEQEERRLFYVAMTRARERLILSGAAKLDAWSCGAGGGPIAWIGPAFVPDLSSPPEGVRLTLVGPEDLDDRTCDMRQLDRPGQEPGPIEPPPPPPTVEAAPPVAHLSYTALREYERCGYRFYAERMLGLPEVPEGADRTEAECADRRERIGRAGVPAPLSGAARGVLAHALLERLDFRRPAPPSAAAIAAAAGGRAVGAGEGQELAAMVGRFAAGSLCARLGRAREVRREQRFSFALGDPPLGDPAPAAAPAAAGLVITGAFDVLARESGGRMLVVDYKSDRLQGADPASVVEAGYALQRLVYALAALHAGAEEVEVVHMFLERVDGPVAASFARADADRLQRDLAGVTERVLRREFPVTVAPHRAICRGCPAEGGLCSWPLETTRRPAPERLG